MARIAAIDFGLRRIGIALSDENQRLALPLTCVEGGKRAIENIAKALAPYKGKLEKILLGLPLLLSGEKGEMARLVEPFALALAAAFELPVLLLDERLSSRGAEVHLKELPMSRKKRTERVDVTAATLLLQSYLDRS